MQLINKHQCEFVLSCIANFNKFLGNKIATVHIILNSQAIAMFLTHLVTYLHCGCIVVFTVCGLVRYFKEYHKKSKKTNKQQKQCQSTAMVYVNLT